MPPPARCASFSPTMRTTVKWDGPILEIVVEAPGPPGVSYDFKKKIAMVDGVLRLDSDPEVFGHRLRGPGDLAAPARNRDDICRCSRFVCFARKSRVVIVLTT
jgi:hypothetical protein